MSSIFRNWGAKLFLGLAAATLAMAATLGVKPQRVDANGDERTISLYEIHTGRRITITYKRNGQFIPSAMKRLNWFLRDWRRNVPTHMDPHLIDLVWELHEESGSTKPIHVVSGYRHPKTNAALRRAGGGQAKRSQHMRGKAMDIHFPDVSMSLVRKLAFLKERGGVGYYPTSAIPFVHVDTARVRAWPRMSRSQLAMLFPYGHTKHRPARGGPLRLRDQLRARRKLAALARKKQLRTDLLLARASLPARLSKNRAKSFVVALLTGRSQSPALTVPGLPSHSQPANAAGGNIQIAAAEMASSSRPSFRPDARLWFQRSPQNARPYLTSQPLPSSVLAESPAAPKPRLASLQAGGDGSRNGSGSIFFSRPKRHLSKLWVDGAAERRSWLTSFELDESNRPLLPQSSRFPSPVQIPNSSRTRLRALAAPLQSANAGNANAENNDADDDEQDNIPAWAERVASAPAWDEEHPDELSYRPFQLLPLISGRPIATDKQLVAMREPRYNEAFDLIASSENISMQFRPSTLEAERRWNNQFHGDAVINIRHRADAASQINSGQPRRRLASLQ